MPRYEGKELNPILLPSEFLSQVSPLPVTVHIPSGMSRSILEAILFSLLLYRGVSQTAKNPKVGPREKLQDREKKGTLLIRLDGGYCGENRVEGERYLSKVFQKKGVEGSF